MSEKKTSRAFALIAALCLFAAGFDSAWAERPAPAPDTAGLHVLGSDETGIELVLNTPDFRVARRAVEGLACDLIEVDGYPATDQAGWPQLPVRGAMLGIPADAAVRLEVLEVDAETLPGRYDLCPVAGPIVKTGPTGEIVYQGMQRTRDPQAYAADALYPTSPAELAGTGFIRSQRVAQVRFHPLQYNAASGQLRHLRRIRARLVFERAGDRALPTSTAIVDEGSFEETLSYALLNYDAARAWRVRPERPTQTVLDQASQSEPQYKISVNADGIYQVTYADLQAAGVETATLNALDPHTFRLHNQGQEVAIYVEGEADDTFDPGDAILFYGQKMNTRYTDVNVYWLTWGEGNGARMPTLDGTPSGTATVPAYFLTTRHIEEDHSYQVIYPSGPDNDRWLWMYIGSFGTPATADFNFTMPALATGSFSATVRGLFRGIDAIPTHNTRTYLNGYLLDDAVWLPATEHTFAITVPQSCLNEGANTISVTVGVGNSQDMVLVNWFEITYYAAYTAVGDPLFFDGDEAGTWEYQAGGFLTDTLEAFDVTTPLSPTRILSGTVQGSGPYTLTFQHTIAAEHYYLALTQDLRRTPLQIERDTPSSLRSTANGADYVIVTHGDFYAAAQQLETYNTITRGLRTAVVDVQDIYDEFNYGIFDPTAIRDFLTYAYVDWAPPAPTYVLLVGDGNYDFKDNYGYGEPNYIPPYLAEVDPWLGETATDNRYVCVSGADALPDMHVGRLPVKTSAEASLIVSRILSYEQSPPAGDWNQKVLFVADNPDSAGNFYALSNAIADGYLPAPYTAQKIYYGQAPYYTSATVTRAAIVAAINEGRLVVNYIGHGGAELWATEQIFRLQDIPSLINAGRLPLMVPMTCMDGYFIRPSTPSWDGSSIGESIVRATVGGAIASWSPTGLGVASGHDYLNRGLFDALFFDGVVQLGPATAQAKLYLYGSSGGLYRDLIDTYALFGDPALALNVLPTDLVLNKAAQVPDVVRPGDAITYTLVYTNTGPATAHHVVITDVLPAGLTDTSFISAGAVITARVGSPFVWDVADLAAGEGGTITVTATVDPAFWGTLPNTAAIAATVPETGPENNTATVAITVAPYTYYLPTAMRKEDLP